MLNTIKQFFEEQIAPASNRKDDNAEHALQLATAALLIEMMHMDSEIDDNELCMVNQSIRTKFGLSEKETEELLHLAEKEHKLATDYYQFTSLINKNFTYEQKIKVIEHLWMVAFADGELDKHEEHLVRKISELLYVPHSVFIAAKHSVMNSK
jgi:uncharacterized tellurite resistance protein B-like protein